MAILSNCLSPDDMHSQLLNLVTVYMFIMCRDINFQGNYLLLCSVFVINNMTDLVQYIIGKSEINPKFHSNCIISLLLTEHTQLPGKQVSCSARIPVFSHCGRFVI